MAQEDLCALTRAVAAALLLALACSAATAAPPKKGNEWAALTADQQQILAPLKGAWSNLDTEQRRKWVGVAKRYPKMTPRGQQRVQRRMEKWVKLTPEQREAARQQYRLIGKLPPEKRQSLRQQWAEYQALPPHEKRMFDVPPADTRVTERKRRAAPPKPQATPAQPIPSPL